MAQVAFVAAASAVGKSVTSLDVSVPSGVQNGDLLIAHFSTNDIGITVSAPAGWNTKDSDTTNNGASYLFWRIAASEPASYTFTVASGTNNVAIGAMTAWRNVNTSSPFDVESKNLDASADTTAHGTAVTPTQAPDAMLVAFTSSPNNVSYSAHAVANNNPAWTEAYDTGANNGINNAALVCAYGQYNKITTTGAYTATISGAAVSSTYLLSLRSAFSFVAGFALTGSTASSIAAAEIAASSINFPVSATIVPPVLSQGLPPVVNEQKHTATWANLPKS